MRPNGLRRQGRVRPADCHELAATPELIRNLEHPFLIRHIAGDPDKIPPFLEVDRLNGFVNNGHLDILRGQRCDGRQRQVRHIGGAARNIPNLRQRMHAHVFRRIH